MTETRHQRAPERLKAPARREVLLAEVLAGRGSVDELAERFAVSPATVRRDLQLLAAQG
ncbi:MAG: DeoR family transcriptional regulator, partial [Sciscionella sp.]